MARKRTVVVTVQDKAAVFMRKRSYVSPKASVTSSHISMLPRVKHPYTDIPNMVQEYCSICLKNTLVKDIKHELGLASL